MDLNQRKEQFSVAYLRAVSAVAGLALAPPNVDDDSVDWTVYATGQSGLPRRPRLDLQLKCTARDVLAEDAVKFPLKIKNYDDLRTDDLHTPRILVVLVVPEDMGDWLSQ